MTIPLWAMIAFVLLISIELSTHYYIIEVKKIWLRKKGHRIALMIRGAYIAILAISVFGVSWASVQFMFLQVSTHWMIWDYALNWFRGKPWHHTNDDVIFDDILNEKDPLIRLGLKSFVLILAIMIFHLV